MFPLIITSLSETDVLDESLLENSTNNETSSANLTIDKKVQNESPVVIPEFKKRRKTPMIGVIALTLLTSFGAMIVIKDQ